MEEELAQCIYERNNLKYEVETLKNEWIQSEETCHVLQAKISFYEQNEKRLTTELEKIKIAEKFATSALKKSDEKLEYYLETDKKYRDELRRSKTLERNSRDLEEQNECLKEDIIELKRFLNEACSKELTMRQELEDALKKTRNLEEELNCARSQYADGQKDNAVLNEIIQEMRDEREAMHKERLEQLLLTPDNLFSDLSECDSSMIQQSSRKGLNFTENSDADTNLGAELTKIEDESLKKELKIKGRMLKNMRKRLTIVTMRAQKYKIRLRQAKLAWKEKDDGQVEESVVTVVVKDGVQTGQPRVVIIETVSIATQTEKVSILAAAVQTNNRDDYSLSESEDDTSSESRQELGDAFSEHRADNYEIDIYRSCRKLSVLPEEETDEGGLHRNSSIRSNLSARLCTSADDVTSTMITTYPKIKVFSCADILLSNLSPPFHDSSISSTTTSSDSISDTKLSLLDPSDALRQPHSFDSYLDPLQMPTSLPRQISDPTQTTNPLRRGSYVKRSTCRPLTLTCGDHDNERVPKVRFDLSDKSAQLPKSTKDTVIVSKLKPTTKISRFSVELVDEGELVRKRPPLIHSVVYKKSVLHEISPTDDVREPIPVLQQPIDEPEEPPVEAYINGSYLMDDIYPSKRRKQSDVSFDDSEGDIIVKSIRLHQSAEGIVMRELSGDTSSDTDIPYIDAEELADIMSKTTSPTNSDVVSPSASSTATFCTAVSELTPSTEEPPSKPFSKSPTVLKNLASFESYDSPDVKHRIREVLEEEDELSENSDTITYVTVKSDSDNYVTVRSDTDSDTYVTIRSDKSLERKYSDLSDHSNSPYNTPPDTSSASFFTPPDTFSPLFFKSNKHLRIHMRSSSNGQISNASSFDTPPNSSPARGVPDSEIVRRLSEATFATNSILFDSPKLEFYETNDSVENLEAFLETEEGLRDDAKRHSFDTAMEKRPKRHPPLSRQNSTEEYIYLEPQDSSLNLSEEMSSPSTTPDTSNKTVIFKNKPLTVSNTIDLDDDDFPISESEIIINLNGSETEIVEIPLMHTCRSEPCIPSMGKSTLARLGRQSCSMSDDPDTCNYPAIVISTVDGESSNSVIPNRPPCPLPEASSFMQEAGNETATHSDADSTDSGCKLISLEPEITTDENRSGKETSLPHVLEALKSLTDDEVESRAQQLELALQTDAQTLVARLQLRQRYREIAEKNLGSEIERMKSAIRSLQYLCTDRNSLDILTTVQTQLDCVMASAVSVSSTSEAYGYVQSEERMTTAMAPLVRYVDTVANARLERTLESPRSPFLSLEDSRDDERMMRRRSVATVPLSLESRRRASIPFLPRPPSPLPRNGITSQPISPGLEMSRRDSTVRQRREIRIPESVQMAEISETPEQTSTPLTPCSCVMKATGSQTIMANMEKPPEQFEFRAIFRYVMAIGLTVLFAGVVLWSGLKSGVREKPV